MSLLNTLSWEPSDMVKQGQRHETCSLSELGLWLLCGRTLEFRFWVSCFWDRFIPLSQSHPSFTGLWVPLPAYKFFLPMCCWWVVCGSQWQWPEASRQFGPIPAPVISGFFRKLQLGPPWPCNLSTSRLSAWARTFRALLLPHVIYYLRSASCKSSLGVKCSPGSLLAEAETKGTLELPLLSLHFCVKELQKERNAEREIFPPRIQPSNGCNSWGWARLIPRV